MRRQELQRMLDEAADQAATQAAAIVLHRLPDALKAAIKSLLKDFRHDIVDYVITERWIRLLAGLLFLLGVIGLYLKD